MNKLFLLRQRNTMKYYSDILDDKHCIYGFFHKKPALKCRDFLTYYRKRHNRYPSLQDSKENRFLGTTDIVLLEEEYVEDMKSKCALNGMHLVGIHTFEYSNLFGHDEVNMSAKILTDDVTVPPFLVRDNLEYLLHLSTLEYE